MASITNLGELSAVRKEEMVAGLATLLLGSSADAELSAESLQAVAKASGNSLSDGMAGLFASTVKDVKAYVQSPGGGGGGGGGGAASGGGDAPAAVVDKEEEEEAEIPAVDMFGAGGGGGDY
jgi:hypothetical protein